ncbi:MAG: ABC transporter permease, partial [Roseiarcus sp.]
MKAEHQPRTERRIRHASPRFSFGGLVRKAGVYVVLVVLIAFGAVQYPTFLSLQNLDNIITQAAPIVLASLGMTFVLLTAEIDLSIGSLVSIVSVIVANGMDGRDELVAPFLALALLAGAASGLFNGLVTTGLKIPSFIVTLAMLLILQGVNLVWTAGGPSSTLAPSYDGFASRSLLSIPVGAYVIVAAALAVQFILRRTYVGRLFFLVGSNARAVHAAGLPVARVRITAFVLSGLFASCAGIFLTSYVGSGQSWLGSGMELNAIAASVIGGTDLFGGRGTAAGAVGGALLLTVIFNLLIFMGVPSAYEPVATGLILLGGVALYLASDNPLKWRQHWTTVNEGLARIVGRRGACAAPG